MTSLWNIIWVTITLVLISYQIVDVDMDQFKELVHGILLPSGIESSKWR